MKSIAQKGQNYIENEMEELLKDASEATKRFLEKQEEQSHLERQEKEDFYKELIEDITYIPVQKIQYDRFNETYKVTWEWDLIPLTINVLDDSIQACTSDVIIQTIKYFRDENINIKNIKDYIKDINKQA